MPVEDVLNPTYYHPRLPLASQEHYREQGLWAGVTLADCVREWAEREPDRIAVVGDRVLTYGEVWSMSRRLAGALQRDGAEPGEYFMAILDNSWQGLLLEVAASLVGVVFVPRSPHISPALAANLAEQLEVRGLVIADRLLARDEWLAAVSAMSRAFAGRPVWRQGEPGEGSILQGAPQLETEAEAGPEPRPVAVNPAAPSLVLATGGTTGTPKSILHGSEALVYAARHFARAVDYTDQDVSVAFAPYGHAGGSIFDIYMPLLHGARVLPLPRWRVEEIGPLIEQWQGTFFVTMGTHIYDLMQQSSDFDRHLTSVRLVTSGAGPDSLFTSAQERFDFTLVRVYGCGECPGHAIGRPGDPETIRVLQDGVPFPGVEARIVDAISREDVGEGVIGDYECRGPNLFMGYVGQPGLTDEAITPDGFYRSGDRMRRSADGYITWSGRSKEIIRRGGLQIDPVEIESLLSDFPGIESVVVVGQPDDRLGERAAVVAVLGAADDPVTLERICDFLMERGLPRNCLPEALFPVPAIPRTELGKFHRARVKNELSAGTVAEGASRG